MLPFCIGLYLLCLDCFIPFSVLSLNSPYLFPVNNFAASIVGKYDIMR